MSRPTRAELSHELQLRRPSEEDGPQTVGELLASPWPSPEELAMLGERAQRRGREWPMSVLWSALP